MKETLYDSIGLEASSRYRDVAFSPRSLRHVHDALRLAGKRYFKNRATIRWADVGCGLGGTFLVAKEMGYDYTGIDNTSLHVQYCQEQYPDGRFIHGDWLEHEGEYDLVTFISSLHHFEDWIAALNRAFSLLAPDGIVMIDQEPTRFCARLYREYVIRLRKEDPDVYGKIEIHWFAFPSILPSDLPEGDVQYHFDYFPVIDRLGLRTRWPLLGRFFAAYRKIMPKPATSWCSTERREQNRSRLRGLQSS